MRAFTLNDLLAEQDASGERYRELLRPPSLSAGIYRLAAGEADPQQPHGEDKIYCVLGGKARFAAAGETVNVAPGSVLFVEAGTEHRFTEITEDLAVLVFFAPAEGCAPGREL